MKACSMVSILVFSTSVEADVNCTCKLAASPPGKQASRVFPRTKDKINRRHAR